MRENHPAVNYWHPEHSRERGDPRRHDGARKQLGNSRGRNQLRRHTAMTSRRRGMASGLATRGEYHLSGGGKGNAMHNCLNTFRF